MHRTTRDKFAALTTPENQTLQTPPQVFHKLQQDFGLFDVDLTAHLSNALCSMWFGPGSHLAEDALQTTWKFYGKTGYSNPPYGPFVAKMLKKAKHEAIYGFATTLLLPVRITKAFHTHVLCGAAEIWFCDKRIAFWKDGAPKLDPKTAKPTGALFDSMIVRFAPGQRFSPPRVFSWKVPPHHGPMGWG